MTCPLRPAILIPLSIPLVSSTGCSAATAAGEPGRLSARSSGRRSGGGALAG
jgi:hypothetical protein